MNKIVGFAFLIMLTAAFLFSGCKDKKDNKGGTDDDTTGIDISELHDSLQRADSLQNALAAETSKDSVLTHLTKDILTIIKNKDFEKLDSFIHPTEGIRFSPYATIDPATDRHFNRESFRTLITAKKNQKINWGNYDGSGSPISLTPAEYFSKFVYDANFLNPHKAGVNTSFKQGNSLNNLNSVYPDGDYTENYVDGTKKNGGIDWKSVRLIYKQINGRYYLVGIVHDQWTI